MCNRFVVRATLAAPLLAGLLAAPAAAAGYWNMPGSFCQCMGYGWGAGYHAPLVLGPMHYRGWCTTNEVRLPYAPAPPHADHDWGAHFANHALEQPSRMPQAIWPAESLPAPPPPSVPASPLFGPPVEP